MFKKDTGYVAWSFDALFPGGYREVVKMASWRASRPNQMFWLSLEQQSSPNRPRPSVIREHLPSDALSSAVPWEEEPSRAWWWPSTGRTSQVRSPASTVEGHQDHQTLLSQMPSDGYGSPVVPRDRFFWVEVLSRSWRRSSLFFQLRADDISLGLPQDWTFWLPNHQHL